MTRFFLPIIFCTALLASCGGGGGGGDQSQAASPPPAPPTPPPAPPPAIKDVTLDQLAGTWFGTLEDTTRTGLHSVQMTISGSTLTENTRDGVVGNLSGTVAKDGQQLFRFALDNPTKTDPSHGILLVDSSATYAVFVNNFFDFAVLQKGATGLPAFATADVNGSWSGYTSTASGSDFTAPTQEETNTSCTYPMCSGKGRASLTRTATFTDFAAAFGRASGTYADTPGQASGNARNFLSADKAFMGQWACASVSQFPDACDFSVWRRQ